MLRPSDIAPKAVHFKMLKRLVTNFVFATDQIEFCDGGANITLHGIKNDTARTGFTVFLQPTTDETSILSVPYRPTLTGQRRIGL